MKHILLVEDDGAIAGRLVALLRAEGYAVTHAATQAEAVAALDAEPADLALLDVALPDGSGYAVCTAIRQRRAIPVLFLSALSDEANVVTGLNLGADDYITKPFRPRELIARVEAALRRSERAPSVLSIEGLSVDMGSGVARRGGREIALSALEYRLLLAFARNPGRVLTRDWLLDELWDAAGEFVSDNTLTVYIKRLREKIEDDPASPRIILTVRGVGYRLGGGDAQ